jgi:hypothetical protein
VSDALVIGVTATGLVYCDRTRERNGDYITLARLDFRTLTLTWIEKPRNAELVRDIEGDARSVQGRRGEQYRVSGAGQTITLGYGLVPA